MSTPKSAAKQPPTISRSQTMTWMPGTFRPTAETGRMWTLWRRELLRGEPAGDVARRSRRTPRSPGRAGRRSRRRCSARAPSSRRSATTGRVASVGTQRLPRRAGRVVARVESATARNSVGQTGAGTRGGQPPPLRVSTGRRRCSCCVASCPVRRLLAQEALGPEHEDQDEDPEDQRLGPVEPGACQESPSLKLMIRPIMSAPSAAPVRLPMPPSTAAVNAPGRAGPSP